MSSSKALALEAIQQLHQQLAQQQLHLGLKMHHQILLLRPVHLLLGEFQIAWKACAIIAARQSQKLRHWAEAQRVEQRQRVKILWAAKWCVAL
jgi:hypothetical protein